jgi:hypothetical protein
MEAPNFWGLADGDFSVLSPIELAQDLYIDPLSSRSRKSI